MDPLLELETQGWRALVTPDGAARRFYASALREDAVMLFPGDLVIEGRKAILASLPDHPWRAFEIQDVRHHRLAERVEAVTYRVVAHHEGPDPYVARIASTYVLEGDAWLLVVHQQTPV